MDRRTFMIAVALAPGEPPDQLVAATYVTPDRCRPVPVDVLVHGATYTHEYWDCPRQPGRLSYLARTVAADRAVVAYDRLGAGESSRPPSASLTVETGAYVLHQVIAWARGRGHQQVNVIGHSLGSIIASQAAALWPSDLDRLVVTGSLHTAGPGSQAAQASMHPAAGDSAFKARGWEGDAGYLTTLPGERGKLFHYRPGRSVLRWEETAKDVVSETEAASAMVANFAPAESNMSTRITAPVLVVVGQRDYLLCAGSPVDASSVPALHALEEPYYRNAASLTIASVAGTGHDLALSATADESGDLIDRWLNGAEFDAGQPAA